MRTSRTLTVEMKEVIHQHAQCTHKGCNPCLDFLRTKISHTSIVVEPKPIFTPALQLTTPHTHGRTNSLRNSHAQTQPHSQIHKILVIMDSSFFSFSVRLQFVRSHTDYVYFFFRSTFFPHAYLLFLSSLNKIDCSSSSSSSSSLFCYGFG